LFLGTSAKNKTLHNPSKDHIKRQSQNRKSDKAQPQILSSFLAQKVSFFSLFVVSFVTYSFVLEIYTTFSRFGTLKISGFWFPCKFSPLFLIFDSVLCSFMLHFCVIIAGFFLEAL
jgi:hypothetical protein